MKIEEAERQIGAILAELETSSGSVVRGIRIDDIETTKFEDTRPQFISKVCIELERLPGRDWPG